MKHSTGKPTKAEAARMARLKEMPCIACQIWFSYYVDIRPCGPTEVQHLLSGHKRRGHMFTIPLGAWHHRGTTEEGKDAASMDHFYGPSLARSSRGFRGTFGTDDELLARTNKLLENHDACGT